MSGNDFSELYDFANDLGQVASNAGPLINSAVQKSSVNVKKAAAKSVGKRKHFRQAAGAIDYEVKVFQGFGVSVVQSEVGYDKEREAGALGNLIEFGAPDSPSGPLAPTTDLLIAAQDEAEAFEKGLDIALRDAERKAGL